MHYRTVLVNTIIAPVKIL